MFGFSILLSTASNVIDKSNRQVLTPVNNSQLLLKLGIPDKFRLVTFHRMSNTKKTFTKTGSYQFQENESCYDLELQSSLLKMDDTESTQTLKLQHLC